MKAHASIPVSTALLLLSLLACGGSASTDQAVVVPPAPPAPSYLDPTLYSPEPGASLAAPVELQAVTHSHIVLGGQTIPYTATAGHLTASDPATGKAEASLFYVAYTADGKAPGSRPLTFFYNGGPGSAAVLLHMGSFAPRRLVTLEPATTQPWPYPMVDNTECLLDVTDLVFLDPVGTGYSEAIAPFTNQDFWGVDADGAVARDFIQRYLAVNGRQASPKYLFGESYGTARTAVLANLLETAGVHLTGLVLQSSILDYATNPFWNGEDIANYTPTFPTYAALGAYYGLANPAPADLGAFLKAARTFTSGSYGPAAEGFLAAKAMTPEAQALVPQLVGFTGLPAELWQLPINAQSEDFNLFPFWFQVDLRPGSILGVYDGRIHTLMTDPLAAGGGDPSNALVSQPFADAIAGYLPSVLGYTSPSAYVAVGKAIKTWNFSHGGRSLPDTIPDLASALALNPALQVLSANGIYDLVTPFFVTERDLARLSTLPGASRLAIRNYAGGHMIYLDEQARLLLRQDLTALYTGGFASLQGSSPLALRAGTPAAARVILPSRPVSSPARSLPVPSLVLEPIRPEGFAPRR
jgi:carboxypeptidase C (cathepsin A)